MSKVVKQIDDVTRALHGGIDEELSQSLDEQQIRMKLTSVEITLLNRLVTKEIIALNAMPASVQRDNLIEQYKVLKDKLARAMTKIEEK